MPNHATMDIASPLRSSPTPSGSTSYIRAAYSMVRGQNEHQEGDGGTSGSKGSGRKQGRCRAIWLPALGSTYRQSSTSGCAWSAKPRQIAHAAVWPGSSFPIQHPPRPIVARGKVLPIATHVDPPERIPQDAPEDLIVIIVRGLANVHRASRTVSCSSLDREHESPRQLSGQHGESRAASQG